METLDALEEKKYPKILPYYDLEKNRLLSTDDTNYMGFFTVARAFREQ
jgi:hypothetical protein